MRKRWISLAALSVVFGLSICFAAFAEETQTNCAGDLSGETNCGTSVIESEIPRSPIELHESEVSYGRITEVGRSYTKNITISNGTNQNATLRVEAVEFESDYLTSEQKKAMDWVVFVGGKRKFDVKPYGDVTVGVRLMVPEGVKGGTYYARVKVSNGNDEDVKYVKLRADIVDEDYKFGGEVVAQSVGFFNVGDRINALAKIKNNGTAGFSAYYLVQYKKAFGLDEWKQVAEEDRDVVPGAEEAFIIDGDDRARIGYGIFTVEQRIRYIDAEGKQKEAVLSHAVVNLPWWVLVIAGGVTVLIVAVVVAMKVRRRRNSEGKSKEDNED